MTTATLRPELRSALDRFQATDWTFADAKTNSGVHGIHPYPAKFIPQIPGELLNLFHPVVGGAVLDPFCGSGTTLVEAQARGIQSFGIDLNPIAALISKVKTDPPQRPISETAARLAANAADGTNGILPDIPRLDHWFTHEAATALTKLTRQFQSIDNQQLLDALRVALSRVIVRVSRQESDTRYAAVDRAVNEADVYSAFVDSARSLDGAFKILQSDLFRQQAPSSVLIKDILEVTPEDLPYRFGLVVTSPPYPNAYEYWLYHKYRMYWLGLDPIAVRTAEIGARPHYFRRNPATADDFRQQMAKCFLLFARVTLPDALICMVIGRSIIKGEVIDNSALLRRAAETHGFRLIASARRRIPSTRKAFNPAHSSIDGETLLVFKREYS